MAECCTEYLHRKQTDGGSYSKASPVELKDVQKSQLDRHFSRLPLGMQVCSSGSGIMHNGTQPDAQQAGTFLCSAVSSCEIMHNSTQSRAQPAKAFLCCAVSGQGPWGGLLT